jgi:hypothetical protein
VRPEKGYSPVLKPVADGRRDAALFRLEAGELALDGLTFQIRAGGTDGTAAVVNVSGGKRCEMKNCVITLDEQGDERASAVTLSDVSEQMKRESVSRPAVGFENCLVRGRGRLVRAPATAPADVTASNIAAAVSGPLFEFGPPARPAATAVGVQLTNLTAVLGGPLFDLHAGRRAADEKPVLVPVNVRADGCLFAPLEVRMTPLVSLTGCDPSAAERWLTWMPGATANGYSGWKVYAEVLSADGAAEPKRWDAAEWGRWSGERDGLTGRVVWAKPPTADGLLTVKAADLEPTATPFDSATGAKMSLLPKAED